MASEGPVCPICHEAASLGSIVCPADGTVLVPPEQDPLIGASLGDYQITERLGFGGMGVVYAGLQPVIGKRVAIKCLHWHYSHDPEQMRRLVNEARAVNAIRHRSIIDIFGYGTLPDGRQYLVMELLEGESLDASLSRRGGKLPVAEAVALVDELCDALVAAHQAGVVHRDLKPSNVFLVERANGPSYPKLLDFGLAKLRPSANAKSAQSQATGTPEYAAPEQILGEDVDQRSDLYALGVMFYQLLVGKPPFAGTSVVQLLHHHLNTPPPRPSAENGELPRALDELVFRLMQKKPEDRPGSAAEVRAVLAGLSSGSVKGARPTARRWGWLAGAFVGVLGVGLLTWQVARTPVARVVASKPERDGTQASRAAAEVRALLGADLLGPEGAAAKLDHAIALHGSATPLLAVRGELLEALGAKADAALAGRMYAEALPWLEKAAALRPHDEETARKLERAGQGVFAERSGMVAVGELWVDRYEWPNRRGQLPLTSVDWKEAAGLCASVQKRLCSEAEWESACRGEKQRGWPYGRRYTQALCQTNQRALAPAGSRARCATGEGVMDLSGNAAEWTASPISPSAPQRVVRGGAFHQAGAKVSCGARDYFLPGVGGAKHLGFRCCL